MNEMQFMDACKQIINERLGTDLNTAISVVHMESQEFDYPSYTSVIETIDDKQIKGSYEHIFIFYADDDDFTVKSCMYNEAPKFEELRTFKVEEFDE